MSVDEAVDRADVLVVAVWLDDFRQFIAHYGGRLAGKVIVDPSNPVGPDGAGGYRKVIGEQESSGEILAGLLLTGARLVKAFGSLSAPSLAAATRRDPTGLCSSTPLTMTRPGRVAVSPGRSRRARRPRSW